MSIQRIKTRIIRKGRGAIFTPTAFLDLGARANIDQTLSRLVTNGMIRRLAHGLYDYPVIDPRLGPLTPSPDALAKALADSAGQILMMSPARAANMFGLTTQVPAKTIYLTDGPTRSKQIGRQTIQFRNASANTLTEAGRASGAVFQALRYLGKDGLDDAALNKISNTLGDADKKALLKDSVKVPAWMQRPVQQIAAPACMAE